eukprot:gene17602-3580_t
MAAAPPPGGCGKSRSYYGTSPAAGGALHGASDAASDRPGEVETSRDPGA